MDLEQKCEALEQRIEELESDNSFKDRRICDLNNEIDRSRQKLTVEDKNRIEELLARISELEKERDEHQIERSSLLEEIKILNEEKAILQLSKEDLFLKIVEYERRMPADQEKIVPLECPPSTLRLYDKKEKSDYDYERMKSTVETYRKLNDNLSSKNSFLQETMRARENKLEENFEEIARLREESGKLTVQLEDFKRIASSLEQELIRKEADLERMEENVCKNEKIIENVNCTLRVCETEKTRLNELICGLRDELGEKSQRLNQLINAKDETKLNETKRKLEQEIKKQEHLCAKFVILQNELVDEKNNTKIFREKCDDLRAGMATFKAMMSRLEDETNAAEERNANLIVENRQLFDSYQVKIDESRTLIEAKNFLAKRNEELLQENAEMVVKYHMVNKELDAKIALLDDMSRKLSEIEQLRLENRRIKVESEEILRSLDGDLSDSFRKEGIGTFRSKDRKVGRRMNFDRLTLQNTKLEERNAALTEFVTELRERLEKEIQAKNSVIAHTNTIKDILCERRIRLGR